MSAPVRRTGRELRVNGDRLGPRSRALRSTFFQGELHGRLRCPANHFFCSASVRRGHRDVLPHALRRGRAFHSDRPIPESPRPSDGSTTRRHAFASQYGYLPRPPSNLDLGISFPTNRHGRPSSKDRFPFRAQLGICAFLFAVTLGLTSDTCPPSPERCW